MCEQGGVVEERGDGGGEFATERREEAVEELGVGVDVAVCAARCGCVGVGTVESDDCTA